MRPGMHGAIGGAAATAVAPANVAPGRRAVGVILDSGGVMIRPIGGEWFPMASLEQVLAALGTPAARTVFVDDWPGHVEAANRLGLRGVWLRHGSHDPVSGLEQIADLRAVLEIAG